MKTIYCLRTRIDDSQPWSETTYYRTRKERDSDAAHCRILGGIRTHSFEEKKTPKEIAELLAPYPLSSGKTLTTNTNRKNEDR